MGFLNFLKSVVGGITVGGDENVFQTNDDYALSRLRHAIYGDWWHDHTITGGAEPSGVFRVHGGKTYKATLRRCDCGDETEEGRKIVPCAHMYRIALESGRLEGFIGDAKVKGMVRGMRRPLANALTELVAGGYYHERLSKARRWSGSKVTFDELQALGLVSGTKESYVLTPYFVDHAASIVFYTMGGDGMKAELPSEAPRILPNTAPHPTVYGDWRDEYLTVEPYSLRRLRFSFMGYACNGFVVKQGARPSATFDDKGIERRVTLEGCECKDDKPCIHMYRLALETGELIKLVDNPKVKEAVDAITDNSFKHFDSALHGGYYEMKGHSWSGTEECFKELLELGIVEGDEKSYNYTKFFMDNRIAFIYYSYMDPRSKRRRDLRS